MVDSSAKEPFTSEELADFEQARNESDSEFIAALRICNEVGSLLNDLHQNNYSEKFWRILLLPHVRKQQLTLKHSSRSASTVPRRVKSEAKRRALINQLASLTKLTVETARYRNLCKALAESKQIVWGFPEFSSPAGKVLKVARPILLRLGEAEKREALNKLSERQSDQFLLAVTQSLPKFLVEHFLHWCSCVPLIAPESKSFHVCLEGNEFMRLILALYSECGARIHRYQHGSHYGEQHNMERAERECADYFHTWGWRIEDKDVPDVAYRLHAFKQAYDRYTRLYSKKYDLLICLPALSDQIFEREKTKVVELLKGIDRDRYPNILVRPRPVNKFKLDRRLNSELRKFKVEIDSAKRPVYKSMAESNAVVHLASPSTTLLEALFVDKPIMTMLVNSKPSELIIPYYSYMLKRSVYHQSCISLVRSLNSTRLEDWFADVNAESELKSYKHLFLRASLVQ